MVRARSRCFQKPFQPSTTPQQNRIKGPNLDPVLHSKRNGGKFCSDRYPKLGGEMDATAKAQPSPQRAAERGHRDFEPSR